MLSVVANITFYLLLETPFRSQFLIVQSLKRVYRGGGGICSREEGTWGRRGKLEGNDPQTGANNL